MAASGRREETGEQDGEAADLADGQGGHESPDQAARQRSLSQSVGRRELIVGVAQPAVGRVGGHGKGEEDDWNRNRPGVDGCQSAPNGKG